MMANDFEQRLSDEAAKLRTENAPKGLPTCPNCRRRQRKGEDWQKRGDFWDCTAGPILPVFASSTTPHYHPINLALFDPASTYAERLNAKRCPLFDDVEPRT